MSVGELGHVDIHYVAKNTVKEPQFNNKRFYLLGVIDDYSRICWIEVIDSIKAIDVAFATMDILIKLKDRYDIKFSEMMSDNGSEFTSKNNPSHPFEKMLKFYDIKHVMLPKNPFKFKRVFKQKFQLNFGLNFA